MIKSMVGLEAEFLLYNAKGDLIVPPPSWDRDGFPLLGEIRGAPGKTVVETVNNFAAKRTEIWGKLRSGHAMRMTDRERCPLALYKKANRETNWDEKSGAEDKVKNLYGTDISNFSDQILKGRRIQGIWVSCGLHVHFSCGETDRWEWEYKEPEYELVTLPINMPIAADLSETEVETGRLAGEILRPEIELYRRTGYVEKKKKELKVSASRLCKPAIQHIVKTMDDTFFARFAPAEAERTKYRQPGFFELKAHGFEYRSLPANEKTMEALMEITQKAFELLEDINEY